MQGHPRSRDAPRVRLTHNDRRHGKRVLRRLASTHKVYACMPSTPPNHGAHHTWPKDVAREHACGRPHNHLRDWAADSSKHSSMHACAGRRVTTHAFKKLQCKKKLSLVVAMRIVWVCTCAPPECLWHSPLRMAMQARAARGHGRSHQAVAVTVTSRVSACVRQAKKARHKTKRRFAKKCTRRV
jgi:hypothetical protein